MTSLEWIDIIIKISIIVLIGIPTLYALFWGAPYVPTPYSVIKKISDYLQLKNGDCVLELGSGDARFLFACTQNPRIKGIGYEFSPMVFAWAYTKKKFFQRKNLDLYCRDFWKYSWSEANIIFCYLLPNKLEKLAEKVQRECKKETIVVSYGFKIPHLYLQHEVPRHAQGNHSPIYFYRV